jgi:Ca2+-binding EF-hand superfamily protein
MTNEEKENIQLLFNSTHEKMISIYTITNYFTEIAKDLFSKNENKLELISLDLLKSYFHLPYYLTKLLYSNIFKANENELINLKSFIDGMINLYFIPIQEKIKIYFDFFDVLNIGKVYTNDIVLILKHFHLLTKNNNFVFFEQFIKYSFQFYLNLELTFENWEQLIKENSDVFILIIFFFDKFNPFKYENINYLLKSNNKSRKHSINVTNLENTFIKSNNYSQISDCSNILYIYLNKTFNLNLGYKENFTDY